MKWYEVEVTFFDDVFQDAIKGHNEANALINAWKNWEDAYSIQLLFEEGS
jgi:hypothetical protein